MKTGIDQEGYLYFVFTADRNCGIYLDHLS